MNDIQPYCPEIRFSDVDAYGIVHNAKYLVYMEQARIHWWRQAVGGSAWDWTKVGVLVAHHTIDYLSLFDLGTRWRCLACRRCRDQKHGRALHHVVQGPAGGQSQNGARVLRPPGKKDHFRAPRMARCARTPQGTGQSLISAGAFGLSGEPPKPDATMHRGCPRASTHLPPACRRFGAVPSPQHLEPKVSRCPKARDACRSPR